MSAGPEELLGFDVFEDVVFQTDRDVGEPVLDDRILRDDVPVLGRDKRQVLGQAGSNLRSIQLHILASQFRREMIVEEDEADFRQVSWIFEVDRIRHRADEVVERMIGMTDDSEQRIRLRNGLFVGLCLYGPRRLFDAFVGLNAGTSRQNRCDRSQPELPNGHVNSLSGAMVRPNHIVWFPPGGSVALIVSVSSLAALERTGIGRFDRQWCSENRGEAPF